MENDEIEKIVEAIEDEIEGISHYKSMLEKATDAETRNIISQILQSEKQHAAMLTKLLTSRINKMISE